MNDPDKSDLPHQGDPPAPRPRFHFHSNDCYAMGPGNTEMLVCGLKTEADMDWANDKSDPHQGDLPAQTVEQAEMLEAFADRVDKFWSPLKLDMENNAKFAEALRAGAACLRTAGQQTPSARVDEATRNFMMATIPMSDFAALLSIADNSILCETSDVRQKAQKLTKRYGMDLTRWKAEGAASRILSRLLNAQIERAEAAEAQLAALQRPSGQQTASVAEALDRAGAWLTEHHHIDPAWVEVNALYEALGDVSQRPSGATWLDIESAPKDGTVILATGGSMLRVDKVCWIGGESNVWTFDDDGVACRPALWQPVPAPSGDKEKS